MATYEFGRIARLGQALERAGVAPEVIAEIMAGGETVLRSTPPAQKADWMRDAMLRMDRLLDLETRRSVREGCACCLGGKRLALDKAIARQGGSLEERLRAFNEWSTMEEDGTMVVRFAQAGLPHYRCSCMQEATEPLSITYCMCCGGHIKHHLQIALGRTLTCEARSSALSSGGSKNCIFALRLAD
ncbi:MAG: hypothetical protein ACYC4R_02185 [Anaerolineae bacterium]